MQNQLATLTLDESVEQGMVDRFESESRHSVGRSFQAVRDAQHQEPVPDMNNLGLDGKGRPIPEVITRLAANDAWFSVHIGDVNVPLGVITDDQLRRQRMQERDAFYAKLRWQKEQRDKALAEAERHGSEPKTKRTETEIAREHKLYQLAMLRNLRPGAHQHNHSHFEKQPAEIPDPDQSFGWFLKTSSDGTHSISDQFTVTVMPDVRTAAGEKVASELQGQRDEKYGECQRLLESTKAEFFTDGPGKELRDAEADLDKEGKIETGLKLQLSQLTTARETACLVKQDDKETDRIENEIKRCTRQRERCADRSKKLEARISELRPQCRTLLETLLRTTRDKFVADCEAREAEMYKRIGNALGEALREYYLNSVAIAGTMLKHHLSGGLGIDFGKLLEV